MRGTGHRFGWLPGALAALAFVACIAAFVYELFSYQSSVIDWARADLKSRAMLAASTLEEPLRTLDFKTIERVADGLKADGLRLRIIHGRDFFVSEDDSHIGFFDTCGEPFPADVVCFWSVVVVGDFKIGLGRPSIQMMRPFLGALVVAVLAGLMGIAGVLLFFFVVYRQHVRIRELARLEQFRRDFIADISHEIKTPLTGIIGSVDLLSSGAVPQEMHGKLLGMVKTESERLNALAQGILSLARLERGDVGDAVNRVPTDVAKLVRDAAERLSAQAAEKGIALSVEAPDRCEAVCDPQLIASAISNLVVNAIRHSGSKEVAVSVGLAGNAVRIAVEDHGVGIPPDQRERVFERFHRVDAARSAETGGAGLGLAIVRRIARLHGGDVALEPVSPSGCRFVLSLPV